MSAELVHLHVHSEFSMLDGAIRLKKLAQRAAALGQKAVALTDHANMHGTLQFVGACKDAGVKPIVGCEVNLVTGSRNDTTPRPHTHLVLLAENMEGYANLSRIVSLGWVDGMHDGAARVDLELLEQNRAGLIATTACMGGWVAQKILLKGEEAGRSALGRLSDVMGKGNLFVELQDHGLPEQEALNEILAAMAESMDLPIVATNDCHYLEQKEARAQIVLQCIGASRQLVDMERAHHGSSEMFLKSAEEMAQRFSAYPQALANTLLVAERCGGNVNPKHKPKLPRFSVPEGVTEADWMATLAREGLEARFAEIQKTGRAIDHDAYRARLDFDFHRAIWQVSGNDYLSRTLHGLTAPLFSHSVLRIVTSKKIRHIVYSHRPLMAYLTGKTKATAEEIIGEHLRIPWQHPSVEPAPKPASSPASKASRTRQ